jgi:uncharacterized protein (TIGR03086 family)
VASEWAGVDLLERAVGHALACTNEVTPGQLASPTPCAEWDLRTLLAHICDSARVLREAIICGRISRMLSQVPEPAGPGPRWRTHPAAAFRAEARLLLGACAAESSERHVTIGDRQLTADLVAATGAIDLAVHGWDISAACGSDRPIPPVLARDLLEVACLVVDGAARPGLFGEQLKIPPVSCPGDKLVALLGRNPRREERRIR